MPNVAPVSYNVGTERVDLIPEERWLALDFTAKPTEELSQLLQSIGAKQRLKVSQEQYLLTKQQFLADRQTIEKMANQTSNRIQILPVFRAKTDPDSLTVLTGKVIVQPKDKASFGALSKIAAKYGFEVKESARRIVFTPREQLCTKAVSEFIAAIDASNLARWVEPETITELQRDSLLKQ